MIAPPMLMWLHIESPEQRTVRLWLPLFLVWLLLLPLVLLALVCTALADVILFFVGARYHHFTLLLIGCFQVLADTRGMVVRVNDGDSIVDVTIV